VPAVYLIDACNCRFRT